MAFIEVTKNAIIMNEDGFAYVKAKGSVEKICDLEGNIRLKDEGLAGVELKKEISQDVIDKILELSNLIHRVKGI